jgi:hypothetical protein
MHFTAAASNSDGAAAVAAVPLGFTRGLVLQTGKKSEKRKEKKKKGK